MGLNGVEFSASRVEKWDGYDGQDGLKNRSDLVLDRFDFRVNLAARVDLGKYLTRRRKGTRTSIGNWSAPSGREESRAETFRGRRRACLPRPLWFRLSA